MPSGIVSIVRMFQSTRPARGATVSPDTHAFDPEAVSIHAPRAGRDSVISGPSVFGSCFNPRAPRGARPVPEGTRCVEYSFNPRAPRGARRTPSSITAYAWRFQSTRPARGATISSHNMRVHRVVSIHAPRAGRDSCKYLQSSWRYVSIHAPRAGRDGFFPRSSSLARCFNPRAPRGARHCEREPCCYG